MAAEELDLYVIRERDGYRFRPVRARANPLDTDRLLDLLEQHARRLDPSETSRHDTRWMVGYSLAVEPVTHAWDRFTVPGVDRDGGRR